MQVIYSTTSTAANNLYTMIQNYCESSETSFVANIPNFVQLAEERIYNSVQLPVIRQNVTGTMTSGNQYLQLPSTVGTTPVSWLSIFSVAVINPNNVVGNTSQAFLLDKDVNFIRQSYPDPTATGTPQHYAVFDSSTLILGPTPDQNYSVEMHYYGYPASIVTATNTWLGNNFGEVLLYGAVREAYVYLKGETDISQMYDKMYNEGMMLLKQLGDGKDRQDAYRSGQVRVKVQ
jgi:hypothetical protein